MSRKADSKTEFSVTHEASLQTPTLHASSRKHHLHSYWADERFFTPKEGFSYGPLDPHRKALLGDSKAALLPYGKGWLQQTDVNLMSKQRIPSYHPSQEVACVKQFDLVQRFSYQADGQQCREQLP